MIGDQDGTEDIFEASKIGSLPALKYWYTKDPSSIHSKNEYYYDFTPLHYASENGHLGILESLLSKGVDIDAVDAESSTPLIIACIKGHVPIVEVLLDKGANINHQNSVKRTPLHLAVSDDTKLPLVKVLINRGADRRLRDFMNKTPLDSASEYESKSIENYLSSL